MKIILILFFLTSPICSIFARDFQAQVTPPKSLSIKDFRLQQFVVPSLLIATGTLGVTTQTFREINLDLRREMLDYNHGRRFKIDDYAQFLPIPIIALSDYMSLKSKHNFRDRLLVSLTAYGTMLILVNSIKYSVREMRPDYSTRNSFPSGHTATAFVGAEIIRTEYGLEWGSLAYAVAGTVGFLRIYNNRHWLSDVLAGAGIGILSTRLAYMLLPWEQKLFKSKNSKVQFAALPFYQAENRSIALSLHLVF